MDVKWYGTATIGIKENGNEILFDPFLRRNPFLKNTTGIDGFTGRKAIFVTHGHFDHIWDIPAILNMDKDVTVYCTQVAADNLIKQGADSSRLHIIEHGDKIETDGLTVTAYKAKHIVFDAGYIAQVFARCVFLCPVLFKLVAWNHQCPLKDEILIYEIDNGEKRVMLSGSFGWFEDIEYPENADMFVLAHGGSTRVPKLVSPFIAKTKPKKILMDHWDDAFPPLTRRVNAEKSCRILKSEYNDIEFIMPQEQKIYTV
ncbi:MAG: MBL fold metallo-hydrolase [Clostridia bacterium]|nr:MBL fold metallo-hydrolase [Clostridia bacterium]